MPASELERESFSEPLLLNNLVRAIKKLNADKGIGDEELLNELKQKQELPLNGFRLNK